MTRTKRHTTGSLCFDTRRGQWQYFWYNDAGKRRSKMIGTRVEFPTKASAWAAIENANRKPMQTENQQCVVTIAELAERYEKEKIPTRHSTNRVYRSFIRTNILPRWGSTAASKVQPREVELWLRGIDRAPKTRGHIRNILHSVLKYGQWAGLLPLGTNPLSLVTVTGISKRQRKQPSLTVEQFQGLLAQMRRPFFTMAILATALGLRNSEARAIQWWDIDWLAGTLTIRRSIVEGHVDMPKTEASARVLHLSPALLAELQQWRQQTEFRGDVDWLFASPLKLGRLPYSYTGVWRDLQRAAGAAGLGRIGTHSFRHTCRAWLDSVGTQLTIQSKALGHTSPSQTEKYGDVVDDRIKTALEKVSALAFSKGTQTARSEG
jgi:integrase